MKKVTSASSGEIMYKLSKAIKSAQRRFEKEAGDFIDEGLILIQEMENFGFELNYEKPKPKGQVKQ